MSVLLFVCEFIFVCVPTNFCFEACEIALLSATPSLSTHMVAKNILSLSVCLSVCVFHISVVLLHNEGKFFFILFLANLQSTLQIEQ
jgi:hypothetical protein